MKRGRSLHRLVPFFLAALPVSATVGCAVDTDSNDEAVDTAHEPIVETGSPVSGPGYSGTIPTLPGLVSGAYPVDGAATDTSETAIHDGVHFNGRDLAGPVVDADQSWLDASRGDAYSSTEAFPKRLAEAIAHGEAMETKMSGGAVDDAFKLLKDKGGRITEDMVKTEKRGFLADRARWKKQSVVNLGDRYIRVPKRVTYSDPKHFEEIRMRGARQYCAARETAREQNGELISMGEQSAASFSVFGKQIDVLVLEPTAVIAPPERFADEGVNDGAQAFAVPLLLGNKITPIRGLGLPSLGEIRSPLTLVSGDSEVVSHETRWGVPVFGSSYQTVSHASAFVSTHKGFEASLPEIKLYKVGPFEVYLRIGLGVNIGEHDVGDESLLSGAPSGWPNARDGNPLNADFFQTYDGRTYYDGAWTVSAFAPPASGLGINGGTDVARWLPAFDPFVARALQDDDHVIRKTTSAFISGSVGCSVGVEYEKGGFAIGAKLAVDGGLKGVAGAVHTVRDGAYGEEVMGGQMTHVGTQMLPETGVMVTPSTMAELDFVSRATLKLYIKLPVIGKVGWDKVLYDVSEPLAKWESEPWEEKHRLRIGTGADTGDVMKQPQVASHLPQQGHFASFPQDVDACLAADPGDVPTEPEPCEPTVDDGGAPSANICVYAKGVPNHGFSLPVCGSINGYLQSLAGTLNDEQLVCVDRQLTFACAGVSMEQYTSEGPVVSRIVDLEDPAVMSELGSVMDYCGQVFGKTPDAVTDLFGFGACDDNGDLWGDDIIVTDEGWHTPEDPTSGTCE